MGQTTSSPVITPCPKITCPVVTPYPTTTCPKITCPACPTSTCPVVTSCPTITCPVVTPFPTSTCPSYPTNISISTTTPYPTPTYISTTTPITTPTQQYSDKISIKDKSNIIIPKNDPNLNINYLIIIIEKQGLVKQTYDSTITKVNNTEINVTVSPDLEPNSTILCTVRYAGMPYLRQYLDVPYDIIPLTQENFKQKYNFYSACI